MEDNGHCINIHTISGGIVNFGGATTISPITITGGTSGSGQSPAETSIPRISPNASGMKGLADSFESGQ